MTPSLTVSAQDYQDKSAVLDTGFTLDTDYTLKLANPSKDTSTTAENYYITGSSDPDYPLTCNGEEVEDRGIYGSFGIYAPLEMGDNTFTFQNGDDTQTVTITRTKAATSGGISTITDRSFFADTVLKYLKGRWFCLNQQNRSGSIKESVLVS